MVVSTKIWPYERKCFEYNKCLCNASVFVYVYCRELNETGVWKFMFILKFYAV